MENLRVRVYYILLIKKYIKVNLKMISVLVLEFFFIQMERDSKEIGRMAKKVGKELIFFRMDLLIQLYIRQVKKLEKPKWKKVLKELKN
jgi:hypothetical protein